MRFFLLLLFSDSAMLPPLEQSYSTREELLDNIKHFAITEGYVVTIKGQGPCQVVPAATTSLAEFKNREARGTCVAREEYRPLACV